jgi:hypothetical protein
MPVVVVVHRLKNFDEWLKVFKADPPPKIGRWRLLRGSDDRARVHVVGEMAASEVKAVKDWIKSQHMQDVFKRVNAMSTVDALQERLKELGYSEGHSIAYEYRWAEGDCPSSPRSSWI